MICPKCHHPNSSAHLSCRGCQHPLRHAKLRVISSDNKEQTLDLKQREITIGRDAQNDLVLTDEAASRRHARLRLIDGAYCIEDLGSKNGTLLNRETVRSQTLETLDCLQLGATRLCYVLHEITQAAPMLRATTSGTSRTFAHASTSSNARQRSQAEKLFEQTLLPMLEGALQLSEAQHATLWLPDSSGDLIPSLTMGESYAQNMKIEYEIALKVFQSGATIVRETHEATAIFAEGLICEDAFSFQLLGVPLRREQHDATVRPPSGTLLLRNSAAQQSLSPMKLARLQSYFAQAEQCLSRVESATNTLRQFETNSAATTPHRAAERMQQLVLPVAIPNLAGYNVAGWHHPAEAVSGDYLDIVPLASGEVLLVVGDVAGRGLAAATMIFALQNVLRLMLLYENRLEILMAALNRVAYAICGNAIFTTLFLALLNPQRRTLHYVNAGHTPAMFVHSISATPAVELLHSNTAALGVIEAYHVEPKQLLLPPASALLLFTDGLTEAVNESGEQYGLARLAERVVAALLSSRQTSAARLLEKLREELTLYSADFHDRVRHLDDQAALAVLVR